jgi:DnaJ-domain-containing protein 1
MSEENFQALLHEINEIKNEQKDTRNAIEVFSKVNDAYQKSADRVANLAFTVVTASAAVVVLAPAVRAVADYFTR